MKADEKKFTLNDESRIFIDEMYRKHSQGLLNYLRAIICDNDLAEDIACDAWMKAAKHLSLYQPEKAKFNTWIYTIGKNCFIDYTRAMKKEQKNICIVEANDDVLDVTRNILSNSDTQKEMENRELKAKLTKAMETLKPNYRCVAELYLVQDRSYDEICEILDIPLGTLKATLFRAKELLQIALSKQTQFA